MSDGGSPSLTDVISFTVVVDPINNNAPSIVSGPFIVDVDEDSNITSSVLDFFTFDFDDGVAGQVDIQIICER